MSGLTQRYISKELVHFVGKGLNQEQKISLLIKIMTEGWITHPPHNPNISGNLAVNTNDSISDNNMYSLEMTCFADIPFEDLSLHMEKYSSFGLSFSKDFIAQFGGVPVHYIAREAKVKGHLDEYVASKGQYFDEMLKEYHELFHIFGELARKKDPTPGVSGLFKRVIDLQHFFDYHLLSYLKFFNHSKQDKDPDNYYFEREWRVVGNVNFSVLDVKTVFFPSQYSGRFRAAIPNYKGQVIFTD